MLTSKNRSMLLILLAAVLMLLPAVQAEAACSTAELNAFTCLDAGGFEVKVVGTPFPIQNSDGSSTFTYVATPLPGTTKNISTIDILVPVCNLDFNLDGIIDNAIALSTGAPSGWRNYPPGQGASNSSFGLGDTQNSVFEYSFNTAGQFFLQTTKAVSGVTSMGLKIGSQLAYGAILGPACFQGKVATTTTQVISLDPLNPGRFISIVKGADGSLIQVLDENGNPLLLQDLKDSPVWVCVDPILDASGNYQSCNSSLLPITYMPDSVGRFGKHTCYPVFICGKYSLRCY